MEKVTLLVWFGCDCVIRLGLCGEVDITEAGLVGWSSDGYYINETCCPRHGDILDRRYDEVFSAVRNKMIKEPWDYLKRLAECGEEYIIPEDLDALLDPESVSIDSGTDLVDAAIRAGKTCSFILCPHCYRWVPHDRWAISAPIRGIRSGALRKEGSRTVVASEKDNQWYDYIEWSHPLFGAGCRFTWPSMDLDNFWVCEVDGGEATLYAPGDGREYVRRKEVQAVSQLRDVLRKHGFWADVLDAV